MSPRDRFDRTLTGLLSDHVRRAAHDPPALHVFVFVGGTLDGESFETFGTLAAAERRATERAAAIGVPLRRVGVRVDRGRTTRIRPCVDPAMLPDWMKEMVIA